MIRIYLALEQPDDAVEIMDMLIQFNPETVDIKFDMFKMLIETGFIEKAKTFCKRLTKPVEGLRYYNNKGVELSQKGNIRGAIHEYERAILLFPDFKEIYRIHYNIALARIKLNTLDELRKALKSLEISIKLEPTFEKAKFTLVTVNNLIKNMEAAEPQGPAML